MKMPLSLSTLKGLVPDGEQGKGPKIRKIMMGSLAFLLVALVCGVIGGALLSLYNPGGDRPEKTVEELIREGGVYKDMGSYQDALSRYRKALELDPNNAEALRGEGKVYLALNYLDSAFSTFYTLVELPSDNPQDALDLIGIELQQGLFEDAKSLTEKMMKRFGDGGFKSLYEQMSVVPPTFSVKEGSYDDYQLAELADKQDDTIVYYTLDGSTPTIESEEYEGPIPLTAPSNTLSAIAVSYLGYESDPVTINVNITREPKAIEDPNKMIYMLLMNTDVFGAKSYDEPIYDYELAGLTELHLLGKSSAELSPFYDVTFYSNGFTYGSSFYDESQLGNNDLSLLTYMPYLRRLSVCFQETFDISVLRNMHYLEELSLIHDGITDLGSKDQWPSSLKRVSLGWNRISKVSALAGLKDIELLGIWGNKVKDISPLASMNALTCLDISSNNISDISVVSKMPALSELWINGNRIKDLSPVNGLSRLRKLMQGGNPGANAGLSAATASQLRITDYARGDE